MTAGKGISHSERTPESLKHSSRNLHGLQFWVPYFQNTYPVEMPGEMPGEMKVRTLIPFSEIS